eukprot:TRINITY_DN1283_c0_g2_i1.p1 TRINITY_DN1283_c0_g2~~TRINITY_DN1283_c0_g2_i1.p1  ORF type:complete len:517 (-),score=72.13 TRINITY_DN1283_c0_g2_i1:16-1566(-)
MPQGHSVFLINHVSTNKLYLIAAPAIAILLIGFFLSMLSPKMYVSNAVNADSLLQTNYWSLNLTNLDTEWEQDFYFVLAPRIPKTGDENLVHLTLFLELFVYGENPQDVIIPVESRTFLLICAGDGACEKVLFLNLQVERPNYHIVLRQPTSTTPSALTTPLSIEIHRENTNYAKFEFALRFIFCFFAGVVLLYRILSPVVNIIRKTAPSQITWDTQAVVILLLLVFFYDNPFWIFNLNKNARGWTEPASAGFDTAFTTFVMYYQLKVFDNFRKEDARQFAELKEEEKTQSFIRRYWVEAVRVTLCGLYAVLFFSLVIMFKVSISEDPFFSGQGGIVKEDREKILILFWYSVAIFSALLAWLVILIVFLGPRLTRNDYESNQLVTPTEEFKEVAEKRRRRFIVHAIMSLITTVSLIVGFFSEGGPSGEGVLEGQLDSVATTGGSGSTIGAYNKSSSAFTWFIFMWNVYVIMLVVLYYPLYIQSRYVSIFSDGLPEWDQPNPNGDKLKDSNSLFDDL